MIDQKKWSIAYIKFKAYYSNVPSWIKSAEVQHYHDLVSALEQASGEDLSHFKIPPDRVKPKVISVRPGGYGGGRGSAQYSSESYCDNDFFQSQLDGLNEYLKTLLHNSSVPRNKYEQLQDWQLDELMVSRKIKPKQEVVNGSLTWVPPTRDEIISALLKQDNPQTHSSHTTITNYVTDSNFIQNSPGASITEGVSLKSPEFATYVESLKNAAAAANLSEDKAAEVNVSIGTIQMHINSPKPNSTIVKESLKSIRAILESAVGSMLAPAFLVGLNTIISKLP